MTEVSAFLVCVDNKKILSTFCFTFTEIFPVGPLSYTVSKLSCVAPQQAIMYLFHLRVWWNSQLFLLSLKHLNREKAIVNVFLLILLVFSSLIYPLTLYHRALLLSKNSVSHTVALGDMFLHYHEETHCSSFLFNPTDTTRLPQILTTSPNSCPVTSIYTTASCLNNVFPFVLGNYWALFQKKSNNTFVSHYYERCTYSVRYNGLWAESSRMVKHSKFIEIQTNKVLVLKCSDMLINWTFLGNLLGNNLNIAWLIFKQDAY